MLARASSTNAAVWLPQMFGLRRLQTRLSALYAAVFGAVFAGAMFGQPALGAFGPAARAWTLPVAVLLLGAGLAGLSAWVVAASLARPVRALESAAGRLQRGEAVEVDAKGALEVRRLADGFNAMAQTIREREAHITELACHDPESGLGNRRALERRLAALDGAGAAVAVAVFGIDRFARVRAAIGYDLSQHLVRAVAERLADCCGEAPARLTTSSLAIAFPAADAAEAQGRLERLVRVLRTSIPLGGAVVDVSLTCGFAMAAPFESAASLIGRASVARDQAEAAPGRVAAFDAHAYGDPAGDLSLMSEMLRAMGGPAFGLVYQPKHDLRRGAVSGVEALARWTHPVRGAIPPDRFVALAEQTGHIREMTDWTLQQAMADQRRLAQAGLQLDMSVNLSGRLLSDDAFIGGVIESARRREGALCLEITETAVIDDPARARANVARLSAAGLTISIDDYGAGLSSLSYLRELRAHELKIDKAFVTSLGRSSADALLVRSTVDLGHSLGMKVTAEGVETAVAHALLAGMGCDLAQGWFIARPMRREALEAFLLDGAVAPAAAVRAAG